MHALTPAVMLAFIATGAAASSAVDCPAHRGIYLRDGDGATFTARRYGEAEDGAFFYSMQEGTLGRRVVESRTMAEVVRLASPPRSSAERKPTW